MARSMKYNPKTADKHLDELPEPGDIMEINGREHVVTGVDVINESEIHLALDFNRGIERFVDHNRASYHQGEKLPERFLKDSQKDTNFIQNGSMVVGNTQDD